MMIKHCAFHSYGIKCESVFNQNPLKSLVVRLGSFCL